MTKFDRDSIVAIAEFGATARGDADRWSDRDICLLVEDVDDIALENATRFVATEIGVHPDEVSAYRLSTLNQMISHGSLFLWHLKLESKTLHDPDGILSDAFKAVEPYRSYQEDLRRFAGILADVQDSISEKMHINRFEQHVMFIVARNVCMLLSFASGNPVFGRSAVFEHVTRLWTELPISKKSLEILTTGHISYTRGNIAAADLDGEAAHAVSSEVSALLDFGFQCCPHY